MFLMVVVTIVCKLRAKMIPGSMKALGLWAPETSWEQKVIHLSPKMQHFH